MRSRWLLALPLALAFGCTPPPSFPEASLDAEDAVEAPPPPAPFEQITGRELALHSSGAAEGDAWVLHDSGFAGLFLRVEKRAAVTIRVTAAGAGQFLLAVGEQVQSFSVAAEPKPYEYTLELPPGTHFLRIDTTLPSGAPTGFGISSVSVRGAQLARDASDRAALDAANTFIQNYRKGSVKLQLHGVEPGAAVQIKLMRHAFDFGVAVSGAESRFLTAPAAPGSEAARYRELVLQHFNTVVLADGGAPIDEGQERDPIGFGAVDRLLGFARANALHARVQTSLGELRERIDYLVRRRAAGYRALDVFDESVRQDRHSSAYGVDGVAQILKETARAVQAAGADTKLYLDESDVLQFSKAPAPGPSALPSPQGGSGAADPFGNAYRWHAEALRRAGAPLGGLGVQYLADGRAAALLGDDTHRLARIFGVLQNLSGTGLELSLTRFSLEPGDGVPPERAADILEEALRLALGTPAASAALIASAWAGAADHPAPSSALFDQHFAPTPAGVRYEALMKEWDTNLSAPLGADGSVEFAGFYGAYLIQSGGKSGCLSLRKGQTEYELELQAAPRGPSAALRCRAL